MLFKPYGGTRDELDKVTKKHPGYVYLTSDDKKLHADLDEETRITINADFADGADTANAIVDGDGEVILSSEVALSIENGGTGATTAEEALENLDLFNKSQVLEEIAKGTAKAYNITINPSDWNAQGEYMYENKDLRCGVNGDVPPLIACIDNKEEYINIMSANANRKSGILFKVDPIPENSISLVIIDSFGGGDGDRNNHGIPEGGTVGQFLAKKSDEDFDAEWMTLEPGSTTKVSAIRVTKAPSKTSYLAEDVFSAIGMEVTADYTIDGLPFTSAVVPNNSLVITPEPLVDGINSVTISYTEKGITASTTQAITVTHRLKGIAVSALPSKTSYKYNESLNTSGITVTASYSDGTSKTITPKSYSPTVMNEVTSTYPITVTYEENGAAATTSFNVNVEKADNVISFSPSNVSINGTNYSSGVAVSVTSLSTGTMAVSSNKTAITATASGRTITVKGDGSTATTAAITVSIAADEHYNASTTTLSVVAEYWSWGDETAIGDAAWWADLKNWIQTASDSELEACLGKKKKTSLSTAVLGANAASMICIGYNIDANKTLTFQTEGVLPTTTTFGSNALWNGSTAQSLCNNFASYCSASEAIKTITKLTSSYCNSARNNPADVSTTAKCWLPSECEMGLNSYSPSSLEWTSGGKAQAYQYYTDNTRRIKYIMNADGSLTTTAKWYWERSRYYISSASTYVCSVKSDGGANYHTYSNSYGLAPALTIG